MKKSSASPWSPEAAAASEADRYAPTLSSLKLHRKLLLSSIDSKQKRIQRESKGNPIISQAAAQRGAASTRPTAAAPSSLSAAYYSSRPASSEDELVSLESELRHVAASEEVRSRARIVSRHLCTIRVVEEQRIVKDSETRARRVLANESQNSMYILLERMTLSHEEVRAREQIAFAASPSDEVVQALRCIQHNHLFEAEASIRAHVFDAERLMRSEVLGRKIVATLQLLSGVPLAAASLSLRRQHEAESAIGVEAFHLIARERKVRDVVVDNEDVDRCALLARMLDSWSTCAGVTALHVDAREFDRSVRERLREQERQNQFEQVTLQMFHVENISRGEVERHEAATRFDLRVCAAREWKSIYTSSLSARRGLVLAQHVEKLERERLHREHRKQFSTLVQRMWKREEQLRDKQRAREWLVNDCASSVTALWRQENRKFAELLQAHKVVQLNMACLSALHILTINEERARVAVERTQLTETLRLHSTFIQLNFLSGALYQKRIAIPANEKSERKDLFQRYRSGTAAHQIDEIEMAEINGRCAIEVVSSRLMQGFCVQQIQEAHKVFVEIPLFNQEAMGRHLIEAEEQVACKGNTLSMFVEAEQAQRSSIIRSAEQRQRAKIIAVFCASMEGKGRRKIIRAANASWNTITKRCVGERVVITRGLVETDETVARALLRTQLTSNDPHYILRHALQAEEYRARLSIIAEAEVAASVGARFSLLFFPDIPHVSYKPIGYVETEGNRYHDAPASLSTAIANLAKCTTEDIEPKWRVGIEHEWRASWHNMYTVFSEVVERQRVMESEEREWSVGLMDVFQRVLGEERSHQTSTQNTVNTPEFEGSLLDSHGDIFSYLSKATNHEAGLAVRLALARRRVQRQLGPLLQDVFVQHTTLTLKERMEREHIEDIIHQRLQRQVNFENSYLQTGMQGTAHIARDPYAGIRSSSSSSIGLYTGGEDALLSYKIIPEVSLRYILLTVMQNSEEGNESCDGGSETSGNFLKGQEHFMMYWERHEASLGSSWQSVESDATPLVVMQRVTVGQTELLTLAPLCEVSWAMNEYSEESAPNSSASRRSRVTFSVRVPNLHSTSATPQEDGTLFSSSDMCDVVTGCVDSEDIHGGEDDETPCVENDAPLEAARGIVSVVELAYSDTHKCTAKLFLLENENIAAELDEESPADYHSESGRSTSSSLSQSIV